MQRRLRWVLDDGAAVELAGRPPGWREAAERIARDQIVNVSRSGVVSLPATRSGLTLEQAAERVARASLSLYEELLELE